MFFKIIFFEKFSQELYQSVKQFGSKLGLTFCQARSGFKLFAKLAADIISKILMHINIMSFYKEILAKCSNATNLKRQTVFLNASNILYFSKKQNKTC